MDEKKKEMSEAKKEIWLAVTTGAAIGFAAVAYLQQERIEDIEAENEHYKEFCREHFQENAESVKENAPQNEDGDYVFDVDGLYCSVPAQLPSPSQG